MLKVVLSKDRFERMRERFDRVAVERPHWKRRHRYYYGKLSEYFRFLIPEGARVLDVGSGDGVLLSDLKPARGVGIDLSPAFVAAAKEHFPRLEFREGRAETFRLAPEEKFDYVVLSDLVGHLEDIQAAFENLHQACLPSTRVILNYYNYIWEPLLSLGARLGFNMTQGPQNWLSRGDLENLLALSGFETVKTLKKIIFPVYIPFVSDFINRFFANLPFVRLFCLTEFIVARPKPLIRRTPPSVSVVIACRNEKGNIQELVERIPEFPGRSEILFVDGRSTDGTLEEIERVRGLYPQRNIRVFHQTEALGKGGAVRIGFEHAQGEALIILDADISVAPEDLVKFYEPLLCGTGEFINGSRLVYPMEKQAMRFLNVLGNKFFSLAFTYLLDQPIKDTLCGTKVLYKEDYDKIARNRAFFGEFDPFGDFDLLFGAAKQNLKIAEVPVRYYERRYGTTKIRRFRHGLLLLGMCGIAMRKLKFV